MRKKYFFLMYKFWKYIIYPNILEVSNNTFLKDNTAYDYNYSEGGGQEEGKKDKKGTHTNNNNKK